MAPNPSGKCTKIIGRNMSGKMVDELEKHAELMCLFTIKYAKSILQQWIDSGKKLKLQEG